MKYFLKFSCDASSAAGLSHRYQIFKIIHNNFKNILTIYNKSYKKKRDLQMWEIALRFVDAKRQQVSGSTNIRYCKAVAASAER